MRIGSQSMSSTIDPKTICNKKVNKLVPILETTKPSFPPISNMFPGCGGLALANS